MLSIVCEIVAMRESLVPDVSLGTHFFNELVENNMLYLAFFQGRDGNSINQSILESEQLDKRQDFLKEDGKWISAVRLLDARQLRAGTTLQFFADVLEQKALCYPATARKPR